jgi:hypothetical protein
MVPAVPRDVAAFRARLAAAATAEARLAAAYDYLRSRLSRLADPGAADRIRHDLADQLAETAEGLR